jgi:hypothetical protein
LLLPAAENALDYYHHEEYLDGQEGQVANKVNDDVMDIPEY